MIFVTTKQIVSLVIQLIVTVQPVKFDLSRVIQSDKIVNEFSASSMKQMKKVNNVLMVANTVMKYSLVNVTSLFPSQKSVNCVLHICVQSCLESDKKTLRELILRIASFKNFKRGRTVMKIIRFRSLKIF